VKNEVKRIRKFAALPLTERRLLIRTAIVLGLVRAGLWFLPFRTLTALLRRNRPRLRPAGAASPHSIRWAIRVASRYVPGATCLAQALTALILLEGAGFPARFYIGVARNGEKPFQAHAWVKSQDDIIVGGHELQQYTPLLVWGG
jgi:hypothetical protein